MSSTAWRAAVLLLIAMAGGLLVSTETGEGSILEQEVGSNEPLIRIMSCVRTDRSMVWLFGSILLQTFVHQSKS